VGTKEEIDALDASAHIGRGALAVTTVCLHGVGALVTVLVSIGEPAIGAALGIPEIRDNRLTEAFMAAQVCLLPITGRLIAAWGVVAVLRRCSLGFIGAALTTVVVAAIPSLCSLESLSLLLVLQGVFAAPLTPATQALIVRTYPEAQRTRGLALWAIGQYAGFVAGALLAGWIVENFAWQSLFAIAPLVAAIPLPFLRSEIRFLKSNPRALRSTAGTTLVTGALVLAIAAPLLARRAPELARMVAVLAAVVGLFAFELGRPRAQPRISHELGHASLRTLGDRWFALAATLTLGIQALTTGQFEVLLLSGPLGVPAEVVSTRTLVGGLTQIGAAALVGYLLGRTWLRAAIAACLLVMAAGTAAYATYVPGVAEWTMLWTRIVVGIGAGAAMPALATAAFRYLPPGLTAQGATIFAVANSLGVFLGLVLLDTVFATARSLGEGQVGAYHTIIGVEAAGLLALLVLTVALRPRPSAEISGSARRG
jgi:MFS transporter, DHA2 family, multidrug resistance protein